MIFTGKFYCISEQNQIAIAENSWVALDGFIATIVCAIEVLNNVLLFCTKSQGYGPDTIVEKLVRYLLFTTLICTDVAFSHYQFLHS